MPRRRRPGAAKPEEDEQSLLDVLDRVLDKGAVVNGDLVLGVADVDLIYARLSVLLAAFDRIAGEALPAGPPGRRRLPRKPRR